MQDPTKTQVVRDIEAIEVRFGPVLELTPDAIVMVNSDGFIVFANSNANKLFGYGPDELRGHPIEVLLPARFRANHFEHRASFFAHPRTRAMGAGLELFGLCKNGSEFPVEISLSPLRIDGMAFVMSAIRDSSERKRFEQTLREKNLELENASRAKDSFLASMSHELRTPLNAVIGFTGTLLMKLSGPLNEEQEKQLKTIQASARHLLSLIDDLLDIGKIAGSGNGEDHDAQCKTPVQSNGARILVVEDDPASLELVKYLLTRAGYEVLAATDGGKGVTTALAESPDLILCDLQLPVLDGYIVYQQLKENPRWRRVPVVAVTAQSALSDREKVIATGFDGYYSKPIVPETFVNDVELYLPAELRRGFTAG